MKKSGHVTLTLLAAVALAGCARRYDPCQPETFDEIACQQAIRDGGYHYHGSWYPMYYSHPYPYYYDSYHTYVSSGGGSSRSAGRSFGRSSGVSRGGFGSIGSHGGS